MSVTNIVNALAKGLVLDSGLKFRVNTQTLGASKTMLAGDPVVQFLDPGGAGRDVLLPPEAEGLVFIIINTADAAEVLTIENDAGTGIGVTPTQNEVAVVFCDGTAWFGFVAIAV